MVEDALFGFVHNILQIAGLNFANLSALNGQSLGSRWIQYSVKMNFWLY